MVRGGPGGVGREVLAAVVFGDHHLYALVLDFDVVVGAVFDLADDLQLPLGPAVQAADAGNARVRVVRRRE